MDSLLTGSALEKADEAVAGPGVPTDTAEAGAPPPEVSPPTNAVLPKPRRRTLLVLTTAKQVLLNAEEVGSLPGVVKLIENPQQGFDPARVAQLTAFARRLGEQLSAVAASGAVIEVNPAEEAMLNLLVEQSRARADLDTRVRHVCRSCGRERLSNPTFDQLKERNKRIGTIAQTLGMVLSPAGITPFFAISSLMGFVKLDPKFRCFNCDGMEADESVIVFCPQCHAQRNEAVLKSCPQCGHDFTAAAGLASLWRPRGDDAPEPVEAVGVRPLATIATGGAERLLFTPGGAELVVAGPGGNVVCWRLPEMRGEPSVLWRTSIGSGTPVVTLSPAAHLLALTTEAVVSEKPVVYLDVRSGSVQLPFPDAAWTAWTAVDLALSPDGGLLAVGTDTLEMVDTTSGEIVRKLRPSMLGANRVAISPSGAFVAAAAVHRIAVWRLSDWSQVAKITVPFARPRLAFTPDSRFLTAAEGTKAWVMNIPDGDRQAEVELDCTISDSCCSSTGDLVLGMSDGTIRRLTLPAGAEIGRLSCGVPLLAVATGPGGLIAGATEAGVHVWVVDGPPDNTATAQGDGS